MPKRNPSTPRTSLTTRTTSTIKMSWFSTSRRCQRAAIKKISMAQNPIVETITIKNSIEVASVDMMTTTRVNIRKTNSAIGIATRNMVMINKRVATTAKGAIRTAPTSNRTKSIIIQISGNTTSTTTSSTRPSWKKRTHHTSSRSICSWTTSIRREMMRRMVMIRGQTSQSAR